MLGKGNGKIATAGAGALVGGAIGNQMNKDLGQELIIKLNSQDEIITVVKGNSAERDLEVKIVSVNGKIKELIPFKYLNEELKEVSTSSNDKANNQYKLVSSQTNKSFPSRFQIIN